MTMASDKTIALLNFLAQPGIGPGRVRKMYSSNAFDFGGRNEIDEIFLASYDAATLNYTSDILEKCAKHFISVLSIFDEDYPKFLKEISDYPPVIYAKGNTKDLNARCYAVVGTRHASDYGRKIAYRISAKLCEMGNTVVSGLALGIDTEAHKGALSAHGKTIAILAHGLDTIAPPSNKKLAEEILETGGALISEHPPGTPPRPPEFAKRNRIQSGMSIGSIVIESGVPGGAIIQAQFTFKQHRKLFAILPDEEYPASMEMNFEGANHMIKNFNAIGVRRWDELIEYVK